MWNEEPYFANLIPVIFVFTFVYSIILYAFSKVIEDNMLVLNCMIKTTCLRSDRGVIEENVLYHWFLCTNWYSTCLICDICPFSLSLRYHNPITGNLDGKQVYPYTYLYISVLQIKQTINTWFPSLQTTRLFYVKTAIK